MTATKALFLLTNQVDSAQLAASSQVASAPVENLQDSQRSKVWRSGFGTVSHVDLSFPIALSVTHAALVDVNLTATGSIHVEAWDDALGGSVKTVDLTVAPALFVDPSLPTSLYGSGNYGIGPFGAIDGYGAINARNITIVPLVTSVTSKYWRFTFSDANTSYQQCGRIFVSGAQTFTYNLSYGWSLAFDDLSAYRLSLGGQRFSQPRPLRQRLKCDFQYLTDDERTQTIIFVRQFSGYRPFIFSVYPEITNRGLTTTLYGRFDGPQFAHTNVAISDYQLTITEEL